MKVFEVVTEFCRRGQNEIEKEVQYVTSEDDNLLSVAESFTQHCFEYEKDLISVREVLTIVQHIKITE
jgi:ribosomal protein S15P/S13E